MATATERRFVLLCVVLGVMAVCVTVTAVGASLWATHHAAERAEAERREAEEAEQQAKAEAALLSFKAVAAAESELAAAQADAEVRHLARLEELRSSLQEEFDNAALVLMDEMGRERERQRAIRAEYDTIDLRAGISADELAWRNSEWERRQDKALTDAIDSLRESFRDRARIHGVVLDMRSITASPTP